MLHREKIDQSKKHVKQARSPYVNKNKKFYEKEKDDQYPKREIWQQVFLNNGQEVTTGIRIVEKHEGIHSSC